MMMQYVSLNALAVKKLISKIQDGANMLEKPVLHHHKIPQFVFFKMAVERYIRVTITSACELM